MTEVTQEEINIIKRISDIAGIDHIVTYHYNAVTDQDEPFDSFEAKSEGREFTWCARYESFADFIREFGQWKYEIGYKIGSRW
jgi:hypothetical protein